MKKAMMTAMAAAMALSGVAGAQTWTKDDYQYRLGGCYRTDATTVSCDVIGTYNGTDSSDQVNPWGGNYTLTSPSGDAIKGSTITFAGRTESGSIGVTSPKGIPTKYTINFLKVPTSVRTAAFSGRGAAITNVAITGGTPATAPVAAPAPAQINIAGTWTATLTNCRQASAGVVVCTATLRK